MANMSNKSNVMPLLDPKVRARCFDEVSLGYDEETAINEANRCLHCKNKPCVSSCPVNINIPEFIEEIKNGEFEKAYEIISMTSSLSGICGRVCPQETQCEKACVRGIKGDSVAIGRLERFVSDYHNKNERLEDFNIEKNNFNVAIIGSGPAGLSCASDLIKLGYNVTIYEALHVAGGVLTYGIPEFRLPKNIVNKEIDRLVKMGVEIKTNYVIGKTKTIDELRKENDAIFISSGAGLPKFMNIKGENLKGVYSANEFLTRVNLMKAYLEESDTPIMKFKNVVVVGGGNVAMDASRCALRLNADKVTIVYRRSLNELPARKEEVEHAIEEGIEFNLLTNPIEIIGDENKNVSKIKCIKMCLGEADASGRRSPVEIPNSEFEIECDCVIMALGTSPNPLISSTTKDLELDRRKCIVVNPDTMQTSIEGVFAGGDAVTGAATVISAMGAGRKAAKNIDEYIKGK